MVAAKSSRVNRQYKKKYRIRNWREYERGLRSRGDVTIWLSEDAIAAWVPTKNGLRGGQRRYLNLAVRTALTLRGVFSLPLRQTEGFLDSLLRLMGLNLKAPDHTTLSRRNPIVAVPPLTRSYDGPIDWIVDSTGLKILGCGEWNAHKHKASKKRRDWRKLHIGVDAEGFIVAAELTASSRDDALIAAGYLIPAPGGVAPAGDTVEIVRVVDGRGHGHVAGVRIRASARFCAAHADNVPTRLSAARLFDGSG